MSRQQIIMNYSIPPGLEDFEALAANVMQLLPEDLTEYCEGLAIRVEDFPDEATEAELDLENAYDLLALYKSGKEISPGVERKTANDDDILIVYRRPILDMWCESCEDLTALMRQVMIEEIARHFDFSDDEIDELVGRHYQGLL